MVGVGDWVVVFNVVGEFIVVGVVKDEEVFVEEFCLIDDEVIFVVFFVFVDDVEVLIVGSDDGVEVYGCGDFGDEVGYVRVN